jgi:hypothetical protein
MTPARGAGDLAYPTVARLKGRAAPAATFLSPVARDYPSRALGGVFYYSNNDNHYHSIIKIVSKHRGTRTISTSLLRIVKLFFC